MHLRRVMSALVLAFAAGLSAAACAGEADEPSGGAAPAGPASSAAASPSVDVKADTERICAAVVAAFNKEKLTLLEVAINLAAEDDPAVRAKAKADAAALVARLKVVVDKETATAADPKVKAALQGLISTMGQLLTPEAVDDPDFETKMDAAMNGAAAHCPALAA
ncbi:hypothetical protein [Virgisporangium ochraceum]|uniref:Lipoprotein n=1 Tax=Virgisporangium ochraceum TaxID=65505 RepID=A0A8J4A0B9_9ACTN|nr:hypothetical protein [Virgisporangium ochraceum]GIJ72217.1 hypothetical protein Voc01_071340 [Virgisporangium ochraceum]